MAKKFSQILKITPDIREISSLGSAALNIENQFFYFPDFFNPNEADLFLEGLKSEVNWKQKQIKIFGKPVLEPRLTSFQGDQNVEYAYSGTSLITEPWSESVGRIKNVLEQHFIDFNGVLLNYYRNQQDSMGWHRDSEKELGPNPFIASVTFGEERDFLFRRRDDHSIKHCLRLQHGSLLIMAGLSQNDWEHCVPKRTTAFGERINLTYRRFIFQNLRN